MLFNDRWGRIINPARLSYGFIGFSLHHICLWNVI